MRLTLLLSLFAVLGCTDAQPCQTCPPLDGVYAVSWEAEVRGTLTDGGRCLVSGPRVASWTMDQPSTSTLTTQVKDVTMGGSVYDTFDLVLTGSAGNLSYRMIGLAIPEGSSADAGVRIEGTFATRDFIVDGGQICEILETFSAQRISR